MGSHDVDMPMDPITNYASPPPELPLPSSSTASTTAGTPLFQLPTTLHGECRQKNAHTTVFQDLRVWFVPRRLTQTDDTERKRRRPTSSAPSDTSVTPVVNL